MANDMRPVKVPVMLDKERTLVCNLNTFAELEEIYGDHKTALAALRSGSFKALRKFLWLCLIHEDENLTEQQAGELLSGANAVYLSEKILEAFQGSLPDSKN